MRRKRLSEDIEEKVHQEFYIRHFCTQVLLHPFHTQTLVHTGPFTRRRFDTETLLYTDAFTHRRLYTQAPLQTDAFTHRRFYTETRWHTLAQNNLCEFWCGMHLTCKNTPITPDRIEVMNRLEKESKRNHLHRPRLDANWISLTDCENRAVIEVTSKGFPKRSLVWKLLKQRHAGSGLSREPWQQRKEMKSEADPEQQVITTEQVRHWTSPVISSGHCRELC